MRTLDIVLPCYNPPEQWEEQIASIFRDLSQMLTALFTDLQIGLIVVNDGSSDIDKASVEYLRQNIAHFTWFDHDKNRGKGAALRTGVAQSRAQFIMVTDIDFPYEQKSMSDVINRLISTDADVVAGVRSSDYYRNTPPYRKYLSKTFKLFIKFLFNIKINDTQCGIKAFNEKGRTMFLQTEIERYLFDLEFIWLASKSLKLSPQLVHLREGVQFSAIAISDPGRRIHEPLKIEKSDRCFPDDV